MKTIGTPLVLTVAEAMENLVKTYNALRGDNHNYAAVEDGNLVVYDDEGGVVVLKCDLESSVERNSPSED